MLVPLITELDETLIELDVFFKSYGDKLTPIRGLFTWKITESVCYDVILSYEWLISSKTVSWSAGEDFDKLVL